MDFSVEVTKGLGEAVANLFRQIAIFCQEGWRPVGFSINDTPATVLSANSFVEDMVYVTSQLTNLQFTPNENIAPDEDFAVIEVLKNYSPLTVNDIANATNKFIVTGKDCNILTCVDRNMPIGMKIYMRKASGSQYTENNTFWLCYNHGFREGEVITMHSNHSVFSRVYYDIDNSHDKDVITFHLVPRNEFDGEAEMFDSFCDIASSIFEDIRKAYK